MLPEVGPAGGLVRQSRSPSTRAAGPADPDPCCVLGSLEGLRLSAAVDRAPGCAGSGMCGGAGSQGSGMCGGLAARGLPQHIQSPRLGAGGQAKALPCPALTMATREYR